MKRITPHNIPEGYMANLQRELHKIPAKHPVDRGVRTPIAPAPRARYRTMYLWAGAVAACIVLALNMINLGANDSNALDALNMEDLYAFGTVSEYELIEDLPLDSISVDFAVDPNIHFDYYDNPYNISDL